MAVASFDGSFSAKQDAIARLGKRAYEGAKKMTAEEWEHFQHSPFMEAINQTEEVVRKLSERRDKKRSETDPSFDPQDSDMRAPKAHKYDKATNYYKVLGTDEYATQEEVKKAYKQLSLIYHPDKTQGKSQAEKDESAQIFLELKSAYRTLSDNPTRRQYDRDRDQRVAQKEVSGFEHKDQPSFDGTEVRKRLEEDKLAPGDTLEVRVRCRLEKFAYSGHKSVRRTRQVRQGKAFNRENMLYRIHVPQDAEEPFDVEFKKKGDQHMEKQADTLRFVVSSKPHELVSRQGQDLIVKQQHTLAWNADEATYVNADLPYLRGKHLILWGRNPFFRSTGTGTGTLEVGIKAAGLGEDGTLRCRVRLAGEGAEDAAKADYYVGERSKEQDWSYQLEKQHEEEQRQFMEWQRQQQLQAYFGEVWEVVGGADSGGVKVRKGWHVNSPEEKQRLSFGALVKKLELEGQRLHYSLLTGEGPSSGWVSISLKDKPLLVLTEKRPPVPWEEEQQEQAWGPPEHQTPGAPEPQGDPGSRGPRPPGSHGRGGLADAPAMQRRMDRWRRHEPLCALELKPVGTPITLFTKPSCTIRFFENSQQLSEAPLPGRVPPEPFFAIIISSQACCRGRAGHDWDLLRTRLVPLLSTLGWGLLRGAWHILPKPLATESAYPEWLPDVPRPQLPVPWKKMGNEAFKQGDCWLAMAYYTKYLEEMPEQVGEEAARVLSNRAACFASVGHFDASLQDARKAAELHPEWPKPWSRAGLAASHLGDQCAEDSEEYFAYHWEAHAAHTRAVELQPCVATVTALRDSAAKVERQSVAAAQDSRERGSMAMRAGNFGEGISEYTIGIARLPPEPEAPEAAEAEAEDAGVEDEHAALRAALFSNRAGAYLRLRSWRAAAEDARTALRAQGDLVRGRCHLGAALLGGRLYEEAYMEFAKALLQAQHARRGHLEEAASDEKKKERHAEVEESEDEVRARRGRNACLVEMLQGTSVPARARFTERFALDLYRPKDSSRIFAISDLHLDMGDNEDWAHLIDDIKFQDDVLIVAGNVSTTVPDIVSGLTILKAKFRRVFYVVGNHELWIDSSEVALYPDSIAKLNAILSACDDIGVDVAPAPVSEDVFIVPLLSWYNADFDAGDPFPDPRGGYDTAAKWPMDKHEGLWRYMLRLNEAHLKLAYHGTVITCSHFLPGPWAYHDPPIPGLKKTVGCEDIDDQLRSVRSKLHVFGHTHHKFAEVHNGVQYVQNPLGYPNERRTNSEPLMLVYDGQNACMREWSLDGTPPPGYVKKVQRVTIFQMPELQEGSAEWKEMMAIVERYNSLPGIYAMFHHIGTEKLRKEQLAGETEWWDLIGLYGNFTHGLLVVADGIKEFKGWLHSKFHKKEWAKVAEPFIHFTVSTDCQLGMDLVRPTSQKDPLLAFAFLRTNMEALHEGSEIWPHIHHCLHQFNEVPGVKCSLMPVGFGGFSWSEWIQEVWCPDQSFGTGFMLTLACNNPLCFKRWRHSEAFNAWGEILPHCLLQDGMTPLVFAPLPWDITTQC